MSRSENDAIAVFTDESIQYLLRNGFTGEWNIGENAAEVYQRDGIEYVICTRSTRRQAKPGDQLGDEPSHSAFLIGKISKIELLPPNAKGIRRSRIHFDSYTEIAVPNFWIPQHTRPEFRRVAEIKRLSELKQEVPDFWPIVLRPLVDAGSSVPFNREGHSVDPKHAFIVNALRAELERLEWDIVYGDQSVRPDLVVSRRNKTVLFEVKPDDAPASFHCGIGQLLVYREAIKSDRQVIVAAGYPKAGRGDFEKVLAAQSIDVIKFQGSESNYDFIELSKVLE